MKKWICLCLIMLLCAAACAMLAEDEALPANNEPPVEKPCLLYTSTSPRDCS